MTLLLVLLGAALIGVATLDVLTTTVSLSSGAGPSQLCAARQRLPGHRYRGLPHSFGAVKT